MSYLRENTVGASIDSHFQLPLQKMDGGNAISLVGVKDYEVLLKTELRWYRGLSRP